jgi:predicted nucleotidyltransferase component of viral defense system
MDEKAIRSIAARTGLGLKFLSKDAFISQMLSALERRLDERCVLKGGTAIVRAGHLDTPRFSEDVDIDVHTRKGMREIADEFVSILSDLEPFDIETPRIHRVFIRFDARYINHFNEKDRIKIELAPKDPIQLDWYHPVVTTLRSPFTAGAPANLLTFSREDLFAMKIMALSGRQNGKDPFDIWGMWRMGVNEDLVIRSLVKMAASEDASLHDMINDSLESLDWMSKNTWEVINIANHYIPKRKRLDWGIVFEEVRTIIVRLSRVIL